MHAGRCHSALNVFRNLAIKKTKERIATVDQMHFHSESGKSRSVLRADDPSAYDRQGLGQHADLENFIRIVNMRMFEWKLCGTHRRRTGCDENFLAAEQCIGGNPHSMGIDKTSRAVKHFDFVGPQLLFSVPSFMGRHVFFVPHKIGNGCFSSK